MRSFRVAIWGTKLERVVARVLITLGSRIKLVLAGGVSCGWCSSVETSIIVELVVVVLVLVEILLIFWVEWLSTLVLVELLLVGLISLSEITSSSASDADFEWVRSMELAGSVGFWDGMGWVEVEVAVMNVGLVCMLRGLGVS